MSTIVVDQSQYHARTHRDPPKRGAVTATFLIDGHTKVINGMTYQGTVEAAKSRARHAGVYTIVLEDVQVLND
jgi:hypothetical protein